MAKPVRRQALAVLRAMFPDLPGWPGSPRTALLAFSPAHPFRVEEHLRDSHYVIRAGLSGLDPASDIEVTVHRGTLTIYAERWQKDGEPHHTEFRYGPLTRSVRLSAGVDAQHITARYRNGILEVSVPIPAARPERTRIPIENADVPRSGQATEPATGSTATSRPPGASIPPTPHRLRDPPKDS